MCSSDLERQGNRERLQNKEKEREKEVKWRTPPFTVGILLNSLSCYHPLETSPLHTHTMPCFRGPQWVTHPQSDMTGSAPHTHTHIHTSTTLRLRFFVRGDREGSSREMGGRRGFKRAPLLTENIPYLLLKCDN